jgi:hypothetical protein
VKSLRLLLGLLTMTVPAYSQQDVPACPYTKIPLQKVGGYRLKIYETFAYEKDLQKRTDLQLKDAVRCVADVVSDSGARTVVARYWVLSWLAATGTDVNRDGTPDAIVEGYSGGAHCCWTYWFVSLGTKPETYLNSRTSATLRLRIKDTRDIPISEPRTVPSTISTACATRALRFQMSPLNCVASVSLISADTLPLSMTRKLQRQNTHLNMKMGKNLLR